MNNNTNISSDEQFSFLPEKRTVFVVPATYFETLTKRILNRIELEEEMSAFAVLSSIGKVNTFDIPENYFEQAEPSVADELAQYELLNKIPKPQAVSLPADYFEQLRDDIVYKKELAEELKELTTLYNIEKQHVFAIPENYFDTVADHVKEKVHAVPSHISIIEKIMTLIVKPRVVVAYSLIAIMLVASVWYFNKPDVIVSDGDCKTLACLEKRELLNEHNVNDFDEENLYDLVDVEALSDNLSVTDTLQSIDAKPSDSLLNK